VEGDGNSDDPGAILQAGESKGDRYLQGLRALCQVLPEETVTVHEACKTALTGLDPVGPRDILEALGRRIVEMPRHGARAACCGSGAVEWHPGG
jgi:Fe-S oxidoreductase